MMLPTPPEDGASAVFGRVLVVAVSVAPRQKACKSEKSPRVFARYYGYDTEQLAAGPRWQAILFGRETWEETCHLLGIYPCRMECLRNPASWPGALPEGFEGLSTEEVEQFLLARAAGRSMISRYAQVDAAPPKAVDPNAPPPVIRMDVRPRAPRRAPVAPPKPAQPEFDFGLPTLDLEDEDATELEVDSFGLPPLDDEEMGQERESNPQGYAPQDAEPSPDDPEAPFGSSPRTEPSVLAMVTRTPAPDLTDVDAVIRHAVERELEKYGEHVPTPQMLQLIAEGGPGNLDVARYADDQIRAIMHANAAADAVRDVIGDPEAADVPGAARGPGRKAYDLVIHGSGAWPNKYGKTKYSR